MAAADEEQLVVYSGPQPPGRGPKPGRGTFLTGP